MISVYTSINDTSAQARVQGGGGPRGLGPPPLEIKKQKKKKKKGHLSKY